MPRVHQATKSTRGRVYRCTSCQGDILPGERYYYWQRRNMPVQMRHVSCGYPRPTELSSAKTAAVQDAVQDAQSALAGWQPELDGDGSYTEGISEVESILEEVANVAQDVASEYEDGVSGMPDSLQSSPTAEAMNDIAQRLQDWADELSDLNVSEEPDLGDDWESFSSGEDNEATREEWMADREQRLQDWADEVRGEAEDKLSEVPEYEG